MHKTQRGKGIYSALITALIDYEANINKFYIAVERGNVSSGKGLKKVGFEFIDEYRFIRILKKTFNKKKLG